MQSEDACRVAGGEIIEKAFVVIAEKRQDARIVRSRLDEKIEHFLGLRSPVDVIAEMDDAPVMDGAMVEIGAD